MEKRSFKLDTEMLMGHYGQRGGELICICAGTVDVPKTNYNHMSVMKSRQEGMSTLSLEFDHERLKEKLKNF